MARCITLLVAAICAARTVALPYDHLDDQVEAAIDAGTFQNPSVDVRPRLRYWFPDASINNSYMADDIVQLKERGAGGIEFLNYYNYGGEEGTPATNWSIYGYGTPAYRDSLKAALQAHKDNGLIMDFSMGPQSGQGVPAEPDDPALTWELVSYNTTVNGSYKGQLPGWGIGDLVSVTTFTILKETAFSYTFLPAEIAGSGEFTQYTISASSLADITDAVSLNGSISVTAPSNASKTEPSILYASYARRSYERACVASSDDPQNILQNGSFAVDHFSPNGAALTTDFLEQYVLVDGIKELMSEVGNYIWEDSVEIHDQVYWTPGLLDTFQEQHGYSFRKYVPLLAGDNGDLATTAALGNTIVTDADDGGGEYVSDWRTTMTGLYGTYLDHFVNWTNSYLDLQFSAQIGYNLPLDMLQNIPRVNAPETETLSFSNNIDGFRQYSGAANLAGKRIISIEVGADIYQTYSQTLTDLMQRAKHAFIGGVNQLVIHGATYSHTYANTTWPGFTSFEYSFAGQHSRHQPAWDVGYPEVINYLARNQYVLQMGIPKADLVFWDKQTAQNPYPNTSYVPDDLISAGYTYEYLSPENFRLDTAYVENGTFAPTRQAFRALVLRGNDTMTIDGAQNLTQYAQAGLPIIVAGGLPTTYDTAETADIATASTQLESILSLENVHQTDSYAIGSTVQSLGILPRTKVSCNGTWYTKWREDTNGTTFVLVYNDGNYSTGNISFQTTATPYYFDAWTGSVDPVLDYTVDDGYTTIHFSLKSTQTAVIGFRNTNATIPETHVIAAPPSVLGYEYNKTEKSIMAKLSADSIASPSSVFTLSSGNTISLAANTSFIQTAISLTNWTLLVESWEPPLDFYDVETIADKVYTEFSLAGPGLVPWSTISPSLVNSSGIGHYSTSITWSPQNTSANVGAFLTLPPIAQGVSVTINGHALPPLDLTNPRQDITAYLQSGSNNLDIQVSTTLLNVLRPIWDDLRTGGYPPATPFESLLQLGYGGVQDYGIIGVVQIVPYVGVKLT